MTLVAYSERRPKMDTKLKELIHNGVLIPEYDPVHLSIKYKGHILPLDPKGEQMAVAFVRKFDTEYIKDEVFVSNFLSDFGKHLGMKEKVEKKDFDWGEIVTYLENERKKKEAMSKEEKKKVLEKRKEAKELLRDKYGYAIVNGHKIPLQNWVVEPPCIFMSKGRNPQRGHWKKAVTRKDITLNLSNRPSCLEKDWGNIVWKSDYMWIACWRNPIDGRIKHVWLSPNSKIRQQRERRKWDKAIALEKQKEKVSKYIEKKLTSKDGMEKKLATAVYLIKEIGIRVGDERIAGERGTLGCTTLKPENVIVNGNVVTLDFIGKDYVHWHKEAKFPTEVIENIKAFKENAKGEFIFNGLDSNKISKFMKKVVHGVSAKTFRTMIARETFKNIEVDEQRRIQGNNALESKVRFKYINLTVAKRLNHKRKLPKNFEENLAKRKEQIETLKLKRQELMSELSSITDSHKNAKLTKRLQQLDDRLKKVGYDYQLYKDTSEYNLQTSLTSYIDPRLVVEYTKRNNLKIENIYTKTLRDKFSWAIHA